MGCNPKTMGFIPDALQQIQSLGMPWKVYWIGFIWEKYFLLLFSQTNDGNPAFQTGFFQHSDSTSQLTFTTIDDDQVGQDRKRGIRFCTWLAGDLLCRPPASEPPCEHFLHGGEIIRRTHNGFYIEFA